VLPLTANQPFSIGSFGRQVREVCAEVKDHEATILHGWAARDWELTAAAGLLTHSPTVGTLHDHPSADFISGGRRKLMRLAARGLDRVVCVSNAVERGCVGAKYPADRLVTIHNGLEAGSAMEARSGPVLRLGFLGAFSRRKGLETLFALIANFAQRTMGRWEIHLAGDAQNDEGRHLWETVQERNSTAPWWKRVKHVGWTDDPQGFLGGLDLLLFTSSDFDPLPTVLLESGQCGTPVFAAEVGGVPEIVAEGANGWIFEPWEIGAAAKRLAELTKDRKSLRNNRVRAADHISRNFSLGKMIEQYLHIYSTLARP
ncbi:MAG: glycosyltransferase family 4 protein, partial [Limisphaerales bacterium]